MPSRDKGDKKMIVWLTKVEGKLRITDFVLQLEELLKGSEEKFWQLRKGKSLKMVLKEWPIE